MPVYTTSMSPRRGHPKLRTWRMLTLRDPAEVGVHVCGSPFLLPTNPNMNAANALTNNADLSASA